MMNETNIVLTEAVFYILLVLHNHYMAMVCRKQIMTGGRLKLRNAVWCFVFYLIKVIVELPVEEGSRRKSMNYFAW